jgi:rare lipoprotein A (peptidoglycan hydrolase)
MKRTIAFFGISTLVFVSFVAGHWIGAGTGVKVSRQIAELRTPAVDLDDVQAHAESALDEIRTLYQGMTVLASWYGEPYHGRKASDKSVYDMNRDTAAHRSLPFRTIVVMENVANGKIAIGKITDRGPYVEGRSLDVSRSLAGQLDMIDSGLATVRMWAIKIPTGEMVQGRFSDQD